MLFVEVYVEDLDDTDRKVLTIAMENDVQQWFVDVVHQ